MSAQKPLKTLAKYDSTCLTCEGRVVLGAQVFWQPEVGVWHEDCPAPKNLARYVKDAQNRVAGFEREAR